MKRNLILFFGILVLILLFVNGSKRLWTFNSTNQKVEEAQVRLDKLKEQNEALKANLSYTQTQDFVEGEIRDKLGLAKEGETVVILPKENRDQLPGTSKKQVPNWEKWRDVFFGG